MFSFSVIVFHIVHRMVTSIYFKSSISVIFREVFKGGKKLLLTSNDDSAFIEWITAANSRHDNIFHAMIK